MADYRKSLSDMTPEELQEVAPGAGAYKNIFGDRSEKPLSVKAAEFGLSMTPVGTAMEVAEELSSDSPSWLNIGLAVAPDLLGLGPVADPLMKAIKGTKFKTAKGSTYEVTDGNTTVRNKAARPEHPGESGVQPQSKKTIYMPRDEVEKFAGIHQNPDIGTEFIPTGENTAALRYTEDYGPRKAGEIVPGTEVTFTLDPEVGLNPVEILDFRNPRGIHFGNEIIEVESNIPKVSRSKEATDPDYVKTLTEPADVDTLEALNLTQADVDAWMVDNYAKDKYRVPPIADVADAAKQLREDPNFTSEQFREISNRLQPIKPLTEMPKMPTKEEVVYSIAAQGNKKKTAKGVIGVNKTIKDGTPISSRLDIPAYNNSDTWVVSLHDGTKKSGDTVGYAQTAVLDNVEFTTIPLAASSIAAGNAKSTIARMQGAWKNANPEAVYANAEELLKSVVSGENTEWVQVGMNPYRASYFYDKADGMPVVSAEQVIQVGPLVLAKKAKKTTPDDPMFEFTNKVTGVTKTFNEGGMAMDEQMDAVFKSSRTGYAEGGEVGAAPDTTIGVDPVSGNEVPMGATPEEVRDDIPAQLSEGEYVVPADVVRFYGVKFFEDLRTEAKQGYAEMEQNGRIGGEPVGPEGMEMIEPEDDLPFDISELQMIDDEVEMAEGGYLERAMNREEPINRFESLLQFLFKDKDEYGETPIDRYKEQMGDDDMGFFESFMGNPIERGERKYGKKGYAEGGDTAPLVTNPFSPTGSTGGFEIKEYVNDAGEVMYIQFMNGQPMTFIPQGFRPKASASQQAATGAGVAVQAAPEITTTTNTGGESNRPDAYAPKDYDPDLAGETAKTDWTQSSVEDITKAASKLGYGTGIISTGLGAINPFLGAAAGVGMRSSSRSKAYDMLDGIAYQLESGNLSDDQRGQLIAQQAEIQKFLEPSSKKPSPATDLLKGTGMFGGQTSMYENLSDVGGVDGKPDGRVTFADTWLGDLLGFDGKAGIQATDESGELLTLSRSLDGDRRKGSDVYEGSASAAKERRQERKKETFAEKVQKAETPAQADAAVDSAVSQWQKATNAANSIKDKSSADYHKAIKAQSEASRQATAAIKARTAAKKSSSKKSGGGGGGGK